MALKTKTAIIVSLLLGLFLGRPPAHAQENTPSVYQVEAAFLYHFAEFVSWPPEVFPTPTAPIVIGLLGDDGVGRDLEVAIRNKEVGGHPLQFKQFEPRAVAEARHCQILFIAPQEKKRLAETLAQLQGASVLTVSKMNQFTDAGGMINFYLEGKPATKVRFEINDQAARKAGLKISAKLLSLARRKESP